MSTRPSHLFVCGCPRSGTSAAALWLSRSDRFVIGMERYQDYWKRHHAFPPDALHRTRFFDVRAGDTWYGSLDQFADYYERLSSSWDRARFVGDKIPSLWTNIPGLLDQFPAAQLICMYRDPLAVARSYKIRAASSEDQTWGKHRDATLGILEWNESARSIVRFFNQEHQARPSHRVCLVLKYEQLVGNSFDRRAVHAFLDFAEPLPLAGSWARVRGGRARGALSETEKDLVGALVDTRLLREMEKIIRLQRITLARESSRSSRPGRREWYHSDDLRVAAIDYGELRLPGCNYVFRGREMPIDENRPFGACVGSATTFGRFLRKPFPQQLEARTGMPFYNLGIGGARPEAYLASSALMSLLKRAAIVVVELMSARGYPSALFAPQGYEANMGRFMDWLGWRQLRGMDPKVDWLLTKAEKEEPVFIDRIYEIGFRYFDSEQRDFLRDTVLAYHTRDLITLFDEIGKPAIGLLMTRCGPLEARAARHPRDYSDWSGGYPHFVDQAVVSHLRYSGIPVVISRSRRGVPFSVRNWSNNEPAPVFPWQTDPALNRYYPSQEMHDDAATLLLKHPLFQTLQKTQQEVSGNGTA